MTAVPAQSAILLLALSICPIFAFAGGLDSVSSVQSDFRNRELANVENLQYKYWYLTLAIFTTLCCILGLWISGAIKVLCLVVSFCQGFLKRRWRKPGVRVRNTNWSAAKACSCTCSCNAGKPELLRIPNGHAVEKLEIPPQPYVQSGASIMEQLVPEITQHMLSYLDYKSLCNVSMTNSCMWRAANDDSAWKALFHKDFAAEQSGVIVPCGWKAHYAATKAVLETNRNFYKSFHAQSLKGMSRIWLQSDYVKCIHPSGELLYGYENVMENWQTIFSWNQRFDFDLQEERVRVFGHMAWVTVKEYINSSTEPLLTTNVFEFHHGHWYMVHRHSSLQLEGGNFDFGPFLN